MVATRSIDNDGSNQGGMLTGSNTVKSQLTSMMNLINRLTETVTALEGRINGGKGTSHRREHLGGQNDGTYKRLTKVEFPKFDGEDRLRLVSMHVFGKALNWHKQFMGKFSEVVTWGVYETHIKKRFESVFEDPMVELKNLKQTTNVQELQGKIYVADVIILPLSGCEMMLGIQWLSTLGVIQCDLKILVMEFMKDGKKYVLRDTPQSTLQWIKEEHLGHLEKALQVMKEHSLFAKMSKCHFGVNKVEYLRHFITTEGVITDPTKIEAMVNWPIPQTIKQLKGFLGLTGYYRSVTTGRTSYCLLKQNSFSQTSVLSTYEKEFLVVLLAVEKWRGYLMDKHFKIKTDHFSLIYLLDQRLITPFQAKWLPKLLGFDYEISYKKWSENIVADALSRVEGIAELKSLILSTIPSDLLQKVKDSYVQDNGIHEKIKKLVDETYSDDKYMWEGTILKRKGKVVVGSDEVLRTTIIKHFNADAIGGHSGTNVTGHKIGLLQPLPIPERVWSEISTDFIVVVYGQTPLLHIPYQTSESVVEVVDKTLQARESTIEMLKFHLKRSQDRMKVSADRKRSKREFKVGM
nr:retrotransposon-related protein [Tanacetum cinerariifolium]